MDWEGLEADVRARAHSAEDAAAIVVVARKLVELHGERIAPKDVDAYLAGRRDAGAPALELALTQRAGDALVRFTRPPPVALAPGAAAAIPPEVLAKMPASFYATGDGDTSPLTRWLRRYAWAVDTLAIAAGLLLFVIRFSYAAPMGAFDARRALLLRVVGWVAGLTVAAGGAGFMQRAGLLDGPLFDRLGNPTLRLRVLQGRALVLLRGALILVSCGLSVVLGFGPAAPPAQAAPSGVSEWPAWMTELHIIARPPGTWRYDHTSEVGGAELPLRVAWLTENEVAPPLHAIVVMGGDRRTEVTVEQGHAIAMAVSREIPRRTDGIVCSAPVPHRRTDVICARDDAPSPFVLACAAQFPAGLLCVASWGVADVRAQSEAVQTTLPDVFFDTR